MVTPGNVSLPNIPALRIDLEGHSIDVLVFSQNDKSIFVSTSTKAFVCTVATGDLQSTIDLQEGDLRMWLSHPTHDNLILGFGSTNLRAYSWVDLRLHYSSNYNEITHDWRRGSRFDSHRDSSSEASELSLPPVISDDKLLVTRTVTKAFQSQDGKHVIAYIHASGSGLSSQTLIFPLRSLEPPDDKAPTNLACGYYSLPLDLSAQVYIPLGTLTGSRFVFLDHDLWLCVYSLDQVFTKLEALQRCYFLPRDWVGSNSLTCCRLGADGTLYWPQEDRIVRIQCDLYAPQSFLT
jgi:hypothetical protein